MKMLQRVRRPQLRGRSLCAAYATQNAPREKRVYVIAGEASGDAIGAKLIAALQRKAADCDGAPRLVFRGIGGPLMTARGGFHSLFPIQELSVMGLVEVLPSLWRFRQRLADTIHDVRAFQPDLVLTIDSKGFTFRVHRALAADAELGTSIKRIHYVAPSVWAYKHRQPKTDFRDLQTLLHKMLVLLPFEPAIFQRGAESDDWCQFVGHPVVEDFLEAHGAFDRQTVRNNAAAVESIAASGHNLALSTEALLHRMQVDTMNTGTDRRRAALVEVFMTRHKANHADGKPSCFREEHGFPATAFLVCALVGSRVNEVKRTLWTVLEALDRLSRPSERVVRTAGGIPMTLTRLGTGCEVRRPIRVILPTIHAVAPLVQQTIHAFCDETGASPASFQVRVDMAASDRQRLFQAADAAVAVSGTIVMETTLAAVPTVVIYRANRVTEVLAKQLSAVGFVSIPNLLLGRAEIPELLFSHCTAETISDAVSSIYRGTHRHADISQLAHALSTLTPWTNAAVEARELPVPARGSDLAAHAVWQSLHEEYRYSE